MISVRPEELDRRVAYRLLASVVVPRPIAWVSTCGADGTPNLAPFSFFNAVASHPPTIAVSTALRRGQPKDTLRNARETGELVVNVVDEALAEPMNLTSGDWPYDVDEFEVAGLAMAPSVDVRPPRVAAAPVALEARVSQIVPLAETEYTLIVARVLRYHVREELLRPGWLVDAERLRPLARLGGDEYATLGRVLTMLRPQV